ncbi:MAG: hypothetical protein RL685_5057, partial [Pseudomonadota bacterium]
IVRRELDVGGGESSAWEAESDGTEDGPFAPASRVGILSHKLRLLGLSADEAGRHRVHAFTFPVKLQEPPVPALEVERWLDGQGLSSALSKPAVELEWWLGWRVPASLLSQATLGQCLRGRLLDLPKALRGQFSGALAGAARNYLRYLAHRARIEEARQLLWARTPPAPLGPLAKALHGLREAADASPTSQAPVGIEGAVLSLGDDPPRAMALFPELGLAPARPRLFFTDLARGQVTSGCNCTEQPFCRHQRLLVEALLDAIHGETALGAELAELAQVPVWQRLLGALGTAQQARVETERERLIWRLGHTPEGLVVQPVVQQQSARGGWSSGRKLRTDAAALLRQHAPPEDRAALETFVVSDHLHHLCGLAVAQVRLLEALVGHPRLSTLEPPYQPLQLKKVPVTLAGALDDGQLAIGLSVAGHHVSVAQLAEVLLDERWGVLIAATGAYLFELPESVCPTLSAVARYGIALPPEAQPRAAELLAALSQHLPVELPEALRGRNVPVTTTIVLQLVPQGQGTLDAELRVRLLVRADGPPGAAERLGLDQPPGEGAPEAFGNSGEERVWARRQLEAEVAQARAMAQQLGLLPEPAGGLRWQLAGDAALEVVHRARDLAAIPERELVVEWPASEPWQTRGISRQHLQVKVARLGEWFELGGNIEVDGLDTSIASLLAAVREGRRFIELGPGRFARIEAELEAAAGRIDDLAHQQGGRLVLGRTAVAALEALELPHLEGAAEWRALWARIDAASRLEPKPPRTLRAKLRPYQREGYCWLARLSAWDAGACLADDMGLGKTVQCLAVLLSRPGPHLVVAPTSVGPNWIREAQAFAPSLRARLYRGPARAALLQDLAPGDLLVTSYDLLAIDLEPLAEIEFDTLVLDEAQSVKNARTQRARAARAVRARFKLALSGTPVENHLGELWSIFSIVSPGLLGPWEHFRERFAAPIERDGDRTRLQALARLIRPFMLRRTKAAVAPELPLRTQVIEPVELSSRERALYEVARREAISELSGLTRDERGRVQILAALTRLRRLACHPKLVASDYRGRASKLETLLRLIDELREGGQRALVFSQFTSFLALVREALVAKGVHHLYLDGQTKLAERNASVEAWQKCEADFFLLSLKAGGSGLNLIGADAVIHLDPWWNPAVEDQATDRTHRIGQLRPVTAIRLIAQGTIEEAVIALHEGKRALADGLLAGTEAAGKLSAAELVDLIRFGEGAAEQLADEEDSDADAATLEVSSDGADAPRLDAAELRSLRERLCERLLKEDLLDATVRAYLRAFDKLLELAQRQGARRSLEGWRDACAAALENGQLDGPRNLSAQLNAVVRRLQR